MRNVVVLSVTFGLMLCLPYRIRRRARFFTCILAVSNIASLLDKYDESLLLLQPIKLCLLRLLCRQNLEGDPWTWYTDLDRDIKQDWQKLRAKFLASYEITEKDAQAKKFELRMKVAQLKQGDNEDIAEYLKRAGDLARKMPTQADLAYQAILNQNQTWPTLLGCIKHLLDQQQRPGGNGPNFRY